MVKKINFKITLDTGEEIPFVVKVVGDLAKESTLDIEPATQGQYISEQHCLELSNMFRAVSESFLMLYRGEDIALKVVDIMNQKILGDLE
jgi:hypothetical protein